VPAPPSWTPTDGAAVFDPDDPRYWDRAGLEAEVARVFDVCAGCRLCFKYCDAFPHLFASADERHGGNARALTEAETARVMDDCFQCKLCEVNCPYTPRDKHPFAIDVPRLVHRWRAVRARRDGIPLREQVLARPDRLARLARASGGIANRLANAKTHRALLERTLGIHREARLPAFAPRSFARWAEDRGLTRRGPGGEAVLFPTCTVDDNVPEIGRDTVEVFERNGVDLRCAPGSGCCGMPAWERGDLPTLRELAGRVLDRLVPFVDAGAKVVVPGPTCGMMLRREYPELVAAGDRDRARRLADAVRDPSEMLWSIRKEPRFNRAFKALPARVAYHAACHLRAQGAGLRGRDLLRAAGVANVTLVAECSGHDGTYGIKVESFEASKRIGGKAFEAMRAAEADAWVSDCPLAAIQIEHHAGRKPVHPMSLLARAYRGEDASIEQKTQQQQQEG
jgi:Fe-S oxidoreductase